MYNVREFIAECLESIYSQPEIEQTEVILVDDSSPDDSADVAEKWLMENAPVANWRIIHQQNLGLGGARNTGIRNARAQWLWFIDSDDMLAPNALSKLLPNLDSDVITFCKAEILPDSGLKKMGTLNNGYIGCGTDFFRKGLPVGAPSYVMNKCFLERNMLYFQEHLLHEDLEFTPRMLYSAETVREIDDIFYLYRINENSITHSLKPDRSFHFIRVCKSLYDFSLSVSDIPAKKYLNRYIATIINRSFAYAKHLDKDMKYQFVNDVRESSYILNAFTSSDLLKHNCLGILYRLAGNKFLNVYNLLSRHKQNV